MVITDGASARTQTLFERAPIIRLGSALVITKSAQEPNGMKLSFNTLPYQCFVGLSAWSG